MHSILAGKRVLIVEDEALVAMLLEEILGDCGCQLVGPVGTVPAALAAVQSERFDAAVLDVNLAGESAYPVAEVLDRRQIPFLFLSGYGQGAIPADRPRWKVCNRGKTPGGPGYQAG
jgi:CheY-like chemotaxis protein